MDDEQADRAGAGGTAIGLAFEPWYRTEYPKVLAAMTLVAVDADLASDATDEAFARAYERWGRVSAMDSPGGWLYRTAVNVVRRRRRRAGIERRLLAQHRPTAEAPAALDPEVWSAVAALPDRQRTAIALRYLLDLTQTEVAAAMGVADGTVSATLTAARRSLAVHLDPDGSAPKETSHA